MQRKIEELTTDECMTLLGQESVGRLAFVDPEGPVAIPVNFGLAGTLIIFRLEPDSHLETRSMRPWPSRSTTPTSTPGRAGACSSGARPTRSTWITCPSC